MRQVPLRTTAHEHENSPDIFQAIAQDLSGDSERASAHVNGIVAASDGSFQDHSKQVKKVSSRLEVAGFCANVQKCFFGQAKIEDSGHLFT